ncbi:T9SS type A sorting domain-containing protein [Portibacter marinus]|uniref:T9SS type A sorting domain-containing protein n=1 Tax=Portibacter marinus TaxID=2898660 RepID=UPI001F26CE3D|nr:T9SS type A sorting domain-containing protein [Portibacter marinus]
MKAGKLTILFLVITNLLIGQTYENLFGSESTQWNLTIGNLWGLGSTEHQIVGDTVIDGFTFKIVDGYEGLDEIRGFIRVDSLNQKAWYRNNQSDEEYLIMDLALEIGDSLYIGGVWNSEHKFYNVDSIYIKDNRKHVRFNFPLHFIDNEKFTLIEGVVSNLGFRYQDNDYINGLPTILLCAFKNDEKIYGEGECIVSSIKKVKSTISLELFPNPVDDKLNLSLNDKILSGSIEIFDLSGKAIYQRNGSIEKSEVIDFDLINKGIYFLSISNFEKGIKTNFKIIKSD